MNIIPVGIDHGVTDETQAAGAIREAVQHLTREIQLVDVGDNFIQRIARQSSISRGIDTGAPASRSSSDTSCISGGIYSSRSRDTALKLPFDFAYMGILGNQSYLYISNSNQRGTHLQAANKRAYLILAQLPSSIFRIFAVHLIHRLHDGLDTVKSLSGLPRNF